MVRSYCNAGICTIKISEINKWGERRFPRSNVSKDRHTGSRKLAEIFPNCAPQIFCSFPVAAKPVTCHSRSNEGDMSGTPLACLTYGAEMWWYNSTHLASDAVIISSSL